jgi:RNA-directed DNA polymerase
VISTSSRTGEASSLNRDAPDTDLSEARAWVLHIQEKLHQWAKNDPNKRFDDLFNLVRYPTTLRVAWAYVRSKAGSRAARVDGETRRHIERRRGGADVLDTDVVPPTDSKPAAAT